MLLGAVFTILLAGALCVLLRQVDPNLALLWRSCEAALDGVAEAALFARLEIYTGKTEALDIGRQVALSRLFENACLASVNCGVAFFCAGSMPVFYLLLDSRFIPRSFAAFGLAAFVLTLLVGLTSLIARIPTRGAAWWIPEPITEIGTGSWLLLKGIDLDYWQRLCAGGRHGGLAA